MSSISFSKVVLFPAKIVLILAITVQNLSFRDIEICIPEYCIQLFPDHTQNNLYSRKDRIIPQDSET